MDTEEKEYIDKKMSEMYEKLTNPDPDTIRARTESFYKSYYKFYLKWILFTIVLVVATLFITFKWVGLI